jgi:hypothetical protein
MQEDQRLHVGLELKSKLRGFRREAQRIGRISRASSPGLPEVDNDFRVHRLWLRWT